jgi:hypothetical protein
VFDFRKLRHERQRTRPAARPQASVIDSGAQRRRV